MDNSEDAVKEGRIRPQPEPEAQNKISMSKTEVDDKAAKERPSGRENKEESSLGLGSVEGAGAAAGIAGAARFGSTTTSGIAGSTYGRTAGYTVSGSDPNTKAQHKASENP